MFCQGKPAGQWACVLVLGFCPCEAGLYFKGAQGIILYLIVPRHEVGALRMSIFLQRMDCARDGVFPAHSMLFQQKGERADKDHRHGMGPAK